jgi:hypothetical protein
MIQARRGRGQRIIMMIFRAWAAQSRCQDDMTVTVTGRSSATRVRVPGRESMIMIRVSRAVTAVQVAQAESSESPAGSVLRLRAGPTRTQRRTQEALAQSMLGRGCRPQPPGGTGCPSHGTSSRAAGSDSAVGENLKLFFKLLFPSEL